MKSFWWNCKIRNHTSVHVWWNARVIYFHKLPHYLTKYFMKMSFVNIIKMKSCKMLFMCIWISDVYTWTGWVMFTCTVCFHLTLVVSYFNQKRVLHTRQWLKWSLILDKEIFNVSSLYFVIKHQQLCSKSAPSALLNRPVMIDYTVNILFVPCYF